MKSAFAEPVVSGNTISWPDNGWYQVQDAITFQEICSGGRECPVKNGNYNVINHSTGSRWESISVPGDVVETPDTSTPVSAVTVEGSSIRWPDDGWYQVQSASTYATTCSGGSSCVVDPGTYIVINHTSGERFENIVVGSDSIPTDSGTETATDSRTSSWSIEGNTINFLSSGWFQVQREGSPYDYPIVCEGQASCSVEAGRYQIINHSTGEVWQGVGVGISNLYWSQINLNSARLSWTSITYNYNPNTAFNVYMNGELFSTSVSNYAILSDFLRGTNYRVAVYAVQSDGAEELVGEEYVTTTGPSASLISYGRPAEERDTFGFEFWDDIVDGSLTNFPSDCLFAIPSGGFCFSPATRYLMEYSTSSLSSPVLWEFPLPGDNSTNNIEALVHYYGTGGRRGALKRLALLADVTTVFGQSKYEISVFVGSGTFVGTYPILQNIRYSDSSGLERQINLDGADLRVAIGPVRPYEDDSPFINSLPRQLYVAGEYYEPVAGGSSSDLTGWDRAGAFLVIVDSDTGETVSQTIYPGLTMQDVPLE